MNEVEFIRAQAGNASNRGSDIPLPLWKEFFRHFHEAGGSSLSAAHEELQERVRQSGIVPHFGANTKALNTPEWSPGVLPTIVESQDWNILEAGILQRTRLLNAILEDVYGDQNLLREGRLPPALVTAHPGYSRAMQGVRPIDGMWLHLVAFDVVKGCDGDWRVIAQHTNHPSGLGYLLENRLATSHVFPDAFRSLNVQQVAPAYRNLLQGLQLSLRSGPSTRAVLLTSGSGDRTYCEHTYLARYLGLTLVESGDLTVRHNRLYLKTIAGLEPVGIVLQMLCDLSIDPLESLPGASLGVPGLMQVVAAGNVVLANTPGSTFLESPGLMPFLSPLAEHSLGEPLRLENVPTHWCGDDSWSGSNWSLRNCVIRSTYGNGGHANQRFDPVEYWRLSASEQNLWKSRIAERPADYSVQEADATRWVAFWRDNVRQVDHRGELALRQTILRVYAVADGAKSWRVIPGGLSCIGPEDATSNAWRLDERVSVDTWVISDSRLSATTIEQERETEDFISPSTTVSSRAAENLFWLGRYTERAINCVRLAIASIKRLDGHAAPRDPSHVELIWKLCCESGLIADTGECPPPAPDVIRDRLLSSLTSGDRGVPGLLYNISGMRDAATAISERLSTQHWQLIDDAAATTIRLGHEASGDSLPAASSVIRTLEKLKLYLTAITGEQTDHMTRDDGWRLLSVGRNVDRLAYLTHALASAVESRAIYGPDGFELTLELFDSVVTYLSRFQRRFDITPLVDLLVLEQDNPRSLSWVARTLRSRLSRMELGDNRDLSGIALTIPDPSGWSAQHLTMKNVRGQHLNLVVLVRECLMSAWRLSDRIGERFFTHVQDVDRSV
jgi:uncharacterized circularly permuted ATP-grasp superfamily protein/uncharacterized alpha-E superfamily protein